MESLVVNYMDRYQRLASPNKRMVRSRLHYWMSWSKPTIYEKLNGVSLNRVERMLIDGVLSHYENEEGRQLELEFVFDSKNGLMSLPK